MPRDTIEAQTMDLEQRDPALWKSGRQFQSAEGARGLQGWLQHNAGPTPAARLAPIPARDDPLAATIRAAVHAHREG